MAQLILVRHGQSLWNALNKFTGWVDVPLSERDEICGGKIPIIKHEQPDPNWRGWDNYDGNPAEELPIFTNAALDERFYGDLQSLNKADTAVKYGSEQVQKWRRSYSVRLPLSVRINPTVCSATA
jgi:2,3-bisphosphoglycerate-dependent phosphoglycerate mutase